MKNNVFFEENPNLNARIAFMVWSPFHFYVYKNIAEHLPESEYVVADKWYWRLKEHGPASVQDTVDFLKKKSVKWRVIIERERQNIIEKFFEKYKVVVSVHLWPPLHSVTWDDNNWFTKKKSVRVNYGVGKDLATFAPWSAYFDATLTDGPHTHEYLKLLSQSYMVGVPKFDDWFNGAIDQEETERIRNFLDWKKKTILYLPTHGGLSSLYKFGKAVKGLSGDYNILVKLHNLNPLAEPEIVEELRGSNAIHTFDEKDDILPLFFLADIVISDSSSAGLEAILADKPLIILDTTKDEDVWENHTGGREFNGSAYFGGATYSKSIEQLAAHDKDWRVGEVIADPKDLLWAVSKAADSAVSFRKNREKLRDYLFSYNDGQCGERAAAVIKNLLIGEKPEPPVLGLAIRSSFTPRFENLKLLIKKKNQEEMELKAEIERMQSENDYLKREIGIFRSFEKARSIIDKFFLARWKKEK